MDFLGKTKGVKCVLKMSDLEQSIMRPGVLVDYHSVFVDRIAKCVSVFSDTNEEY